MNELLRALHNEAMRLAQNAIYLKEVGDDIEANALNIKAFEIEKRAAMCLLENKDKEPTRSVLFRSAANLAYGCGKWRYTALTSTHPMKLKTN